MRKTREIKGLCGGVHLIRRICLRAGMHSNCVLCQEGRQVIPRMDAGIAEGHLLMETNLLRSYEVMITLNKNTGL